MKQLDAIRAFGIAFVFYGHFLGSRVKHISFSGHELIIGTSPIDPFFVLSGFLITKILLKHKRKITDGQETLRTSLKTFFIRRILRIFPIYYIALLVAFIFNIPPVRDTLLWHLLYASNIYMALVNKWPGAVSHLWSLSVEEQFYLLWPFIILLFSRRALLYILMSLLLIGPAFRLCCLLFDVNEMAKAVLTIGVLDLFAFGALLVFLNEYVILNESQTGRLLKFCCIFGSSLFIVSSAAMTFKICAWLGIFMRTGEGIFLFWFVNKASEGFSGVVGRFLEWGPVLFIGKISYGLYVYHNFVPSLTKQLFMRVGFPLPTSNVGIFGLYTCISLVVATLSWHLIEKPILTLKDRWCSVKVKHNQIFSQYKLVRDQECSPLE